LVWVNAVGAWIVTGNQADPDATAIAVTHYPTLSPDVWHEADALIPTGSSQALGLVGRRAVDTVTGRNEWRLTVQGNTAGNDTFIYELLDGGVSTRASADNDWADNTTYNLRGRFDDEEITFYVDHTEEGHYASAWANRHATWFGLYADNETDARFDNALTLYRGTGLERVCYDSFTHNNGTQLDTTTTEEGALPWVEDIGQWIITNNEADPDANIRATTYVDSGVSNCWICARVLNRIESNGLVFRKSADTGGGVNHWLYWIRQNVGVDSVLQEFDDGVQTNRFLGDTDAFVAGTRYYQEIHAEGQNLLIYVNGIQRANFGLASFNETATWHGLFLPANTSHRADQFRVTEIATPEYDAAIDVF
jgi:hypothetical protein